MERAARSLAKLKLSDTISDHELARAAWSAAVGERIASHTRPVALVRGNLIVETEDAVWQKQLFYLRSQILRNIEKLLGDATVTDVEFRIATPRRPPQTANSIDRKPDARDEADGISDSALRIVYKQARKRAIG